MKFGIGQPMRRHEDLRLITGRGCYTDDVILPRMAHAFVLRSPVAHAHIKRIDAAAARRMPGVLFVATGEDVRADGLGDVPCMVLGRRRRADRVPDVRYHVVQEVASVNHDGQRVESKQNLVPLKKGRELRVLRLTKKQLGREGHEGHGPV